MRIDAAAEPPVSVEVAEACVPPAGRLQLRVGATNGAAGDVVDLDAGEDRLAARTGRTDRRSDRVDNRAEQDGAGDVGEAFRAAHDSFRLRAVATIACPYAMPASPGGTRSWSTYRRPSASTVSRIVREIASL